jgi:hypothetical protein
MRALLTLLLLATPAMAGEADRHDFRTTREALVRQLSPEGRYCRECHARRSYSARRGPVFGAPVAPVPLPSTALLLGSGIGAIAIARKWRRG